MIWELSLIDLAEIEILRILHCCICLMGAIFLILMWKFPISTKQIHNGVLYIAAAFLMWSAMDLYRILGLMKYGEVSVIIKTFSAYNNAFFIASFCFFEDAFTTFRTKYRIFADKSKWIIFILTANIFIVLIYSLSWGEKITYQNIVKYIDVAYSVLTFSGLGYAISCSFTPNTTFGKIFYGLSLLATTILIIPQFAFLPIFHITYFDVLSVILFVSHAFLLYLLLSLQYQFLGKEMAENIAQNQVNTASSQHQLETVHTLLQEKTQDVLHLTEKIQELEAALSVSHIEMRKAADLKNLSDREIEVLKLIDKSYLDIGKLLFISRDTVISHKKNIEMKLGISGKEQLELFAKEMGFILP